MRKTLIIGAVIWITAWVALEASDDRGYKQNLLMEAAFSAGKISGYCDCALNTYQQADPDHSIAGRCEGYQDYYTWRDEVLPVMLKEPPNE